MRNATLPGVTTGTILAPGSIVSGRFQIDGLATLLGQIVVYSAKDQRTQRAISLWAVPPNVIRPDVVNATRGAIKGASALAHKDLVVPFGSSTDPTGTLFIATEPLGPTSVAELIDKKRKEGHVHALSAAYQLLAHAMNGLALAHTVMSHGAVAPILLRVDAQGHVKLAGLGLVAPLIATSVVKSDYVAPEIRKGMTPNPRSDVYSLGVMLYELCTGRLPDGQTPAKSIVPTLPSTFDIIIENCLAESPDDRFESVTELKGALASLVAPSMAPPPANEDLDVPIEFDEGIDVGAAIAAAPPKKLTIPPPTNTSARPSSAPRSQAGGPPGRSPSQPQHAPQSAPAIGQRMSLVEAAPAPMMDAGQSNSDLKGLLDQATTNDAPRWMFVRGGLDHGPLSARELIQAIIRNEVSDDDVVFNMDSGERKKLLAWPQYREFADQARDRRRKDQHTREVKHAISEDSVSTRAKTAVAIALVMVVGMIGVVYYKTLGPGRSEARRQAELDDAISRGQLRLAQGGLQVLETPPPPTTRRSGGGGGGGGGGFAGSYEAAMNTPIEFNFGGNMAGGTLNDREISAPLNATLGRFGSCATAELARGGSAREVRMRIAVGGNGAPIGVSVITGGPQFKNCVSGIVRGLRWRAFGGPRIGFAWGFSLQ